MAAFTLRFRVRAKDNWSFNKKQIVMTATTLAENANMTENQAHFTDGEASQQKLVLFMDRATESGPLVVGSDVLVTFDGPH